MAYVKTVKQTIMTEEHMVGTINYLTKKAIKSTYHYCVEDTPANVAREFRNTRIAFNKNDKRLGHQLVQSFTEYDNVTPELAHKIGAELMERCLNDYQVVMVTHNDSKCIHNQFVINSVSPLDGHKFRDNKTTVNALRKVSDELCAKYGLSVIKEDSRKSKYAPLDNATVNAAKRGVSWKINLAKDLDAALEKCKSFDEFKNFFTEHDYEIKVTPKNITFKKNGEAKGIRADTLAKQFGQKYTKRAIDLKFGTESKEEKEEKPEQTKQTKKSKPAPQRRADSYNAFAKAQYKSYEKKYAKKVKIEDERMLARVGFARSPLDFCVRLVLYLFINSKKKAKGKIKQSTPARQYKFVPYTGAKPIKKTVGNIPYKTLLSIAGDNAVIKLYAWQIPKLLNAGVLLSSRLDLQTGTAVVTVKQCSLEKIAEVLNVPLNNLAEQSELMTNRRKSYKLHKSGEKLCTLAVTAEEAQRLKYYNLNAAVLPKKNDDDKFIITFAKTDEDKILNLLFPNPQKRDETAFYIANSQINRELKAEAERTGEKLCHKVVLSNGYKALRKSGIRLALFRTQTGKYNAVFLERDKAAVNKVLTDIDPFAKNAKINAELKAAAKQTGDKLCYITVDEEQCRALQASGIRLAAFQEDGGRVNIVYLNSDANAVGEILKKGGNQDAVNKPKGIAI